MNKVKLTIPEKISLILKMVIGSAISWELAVLFGSKYPYLGPISLILCLQATIIKSIRFGIARIVGTIIGVASVSILASSLHANGWTIAGIMLISLIIPLLLRANGTILHQIALSVMLVLEFEHKLHGYGLDRIRDSIIGVVVALLLNVYLNPPNFTKRAIAQVEVIPNKLADKLKSLATWLKAGAPQKNYFNPDFNLLRKEMIEAEKQIQKAQLSLKYNPVSQKSKSLLYEREFFLKTLNAVSADITVLFQVMDEWSKTGDLTKERMEAWVQNSTH
ncbi:FUSC family protein [Peribacillus butanolivorans]|uniref:FUSC family protein n=1 Tax=Peribacillus butanolivorans TaxID=421767 RepID=UPI0039FCDE38